MPYEAHWHWEGFCQRLYGLRVWALGWVCCSELGGALLWKGGRVTVQSECLVLGKRGIPAHRAWKRAKLSKERIQKLKLSETMEETLEQC